ncbi:hypothetical protein JNJ66_01995 [Candidatus Saccharibacteria bacterium]|nr:hypothetical protein [Candidatus Saccharibacteria bacterium]
MLRSTTSYHEALNKLAAQGKTIVYLQYFGQLCPHLAAHHHQALYGTQFPTRIALPALVRDDIVHLARIEPRQGERPAMVSYAGTAAVDHDFHADSDEAPPSFLREAGEYPARTWPAQLYTDTWAGAVTALLVKPVGNGASQTTVASITFALDKPWAGLATLHDGVVASSDFDAATMHWATGAAGAAELTHGLEHTQLEFCARCGTGLTPDYCPSCYRAFPHEASRTAGSLELPRKARRALQAMGFQYDGMRT